VDRVVLDASAALRIASSSAGFDAVAGIAFVAPPLFWSETLSGLHQQRYRGDVSDELADQTLRNLGSASIERLDPPELRSRAWQVADELGWAKTYDAEYVALAQILDIPVLTRDRRLERGGASRLIRLLGPMDLAAFTGRITPAEHPDTSTLPPTSPPVSGVTSTESLVAERRDDPR
jgi:predicted nucleic acid-binding protein